MTPEQKARVSFDARLVAGGWHVCDVADANIHAGIGVASSANINPIVRPLTHYVELGRVVAEVDCHLFLIREGEFALGADLQRAQVL